MRTQKHNVHHEKKLCMYMCVCVRVCVCVCVMLMRNSREKESKMITYNGLLLPPSSGCVCCGGLEPQPTRAYCSPPPCLRGRNLVSVHSGASFPLGRAFYVEQDLGSGAGTGPDAGAEGSHRPTGPPRACATVHQAFPRPLCTDR